MIRIRARLVRAFLLIGLAAAGSAARADSQNAFAVKFTGAVESISIDLVPTESARALVPAEFTLVGEGQPVTPIVVRAARCEGIAVDGHASGAGVIIQIGALIVPPDGTGDFNCYSSWYYTTDALLATDLRQIGVPVQHVQTMQFDYTPGADGGPSPFHVDVPRPAWPGLALDGTVVASQSPIGPVQINWWVGTRRGSVKMSILVPQIAVGGADLTLATDPRSLLGWLIGGGSTDFRAFEQFNTIPGFHMEVGVAGP